MSRYETAKALLRQYDYAGRDLHTKRSRKVELQRYENDDAKWAAVAFWYGGEKEIVSGVTHSEAVSAGAAWLTAPYKEAAP